MSVYLPDTNAVSASMRGTDAALVRQMQSDFADLRLSVIVPAERKLGVVAAELENRRPCRFLGQLDPRAQAMHGLCMATKTISLETDAYELLKKEKKPRESFSQVVRRMARERPALTAGELLEALKPFEGKGAGKRKGRRRVAA